MDAACPELGSDCPATGHPVPGQVQDTVLKKHYYLEFFDRFDKLAVGVGGHGRLLQHNKTKLDTVQFTLPGPLELCIGTLKSRFHKQTRIVRLPERIRVRVCLQDPCPASFEPAPG